MKAMILAAGFGTRLLPLTETVPKPLIPFLNKPVIEHTIDFLKNNGITDIIINLHYLAGKIKAYLGDGKRFGVNITYSYEGSLLGTAGGISNVSNLLNDDTFIVINGDIVFDLDLKKALKSHRENNATSTLVLREDINAGKYGIIKVNKTGMVRGFLNKSCFCDEKLKIAMFTGIHIHEPKVFEIMNKTGYSDISKEVFPALLKEKKLFGYLSDGYWSDLGHHSQYLKSHNDVYEGKFKIDCNSSCQMPYLKEQSDICLSSFFGDFCRIKNSSVKGSILMNNVLVIDSKIEDSIVESDAIIENMEIKEKVVTTRDGKLNLTPF